MEKRIETEISKTAMYTCMSRAASYFEKNPYYHSEDYLAPVIIPKKLNILFRTRLMRYIFRKFISPKGIYEYVIARTKYIDGIFNRVIENGFDQIILFGAGFDSRAIRLKKDVSHTKVFELDTIYTQTAKRNQLMERAINLHKNLIFVPIDFNKESMVKKLHSAGFIQGKKTLFIMEGLLMYLDKNAVDLTFKFLMDYAGEGSEVVFDFIHASVLREENHYYGEKQIYKTVKKANEKWTFAFEDTEIIKYLDTYGWKLKEQLDASALEERFFKDKKDRIISRINGTHGIVRAVKN